MGETRFRVVGQRPSVANRYDALVVRKELPGTWNAIRRQKTTFDSYILSPDPSTGQVESIFGVPVVVSTFIPAGIALVFDTSQAVLAWTRLGLTMGVNQFGDNEWTNNLVSFRVEERVAIGVRRPTAVCTVTGLPTS